MNQVMCLIAICTTKLEEANDHSLSDKVGSLYMDVVNMWGLQQLAKWIKNSY